MTVAITRVLLDHLIIAYTQRQMTDNLQTKPKDLAVSLPLRSYRPRLPLPFITIDVKNVFLRFLFLSRFYVFNIFFIFRAFFK